MGLRRAFMIDLAVLNLSRYQKNFNERMFVYFSRLYEKYRRKILPVAVFGYDRVRDEPDSFGIAFPFLDVLNFRFYKLELKKLDWRGR